MSAAVTAAQSSRRRKQLDRVGWFSEPMLHVSAQSARAHVFRDVALKVAYMFLKLRHSITGYSGFPVLGAHPLTVRLRVFGDQANNLPTSRLNRAHFGVTCRTEEVLNFEKRAAASSNLGASAVRSRRDSTAQHQTRRR